MTRGLRGFAGRLGSNAARAFRRAVARAALPRDGFWLRLRLAPPLDDLPRPVWLAGRERALPFLGLLRALESAAADPRVLGVHLHLQGAPRGLADLQSLLRALRALRGAGKPVTAWGEALRGDDLLLASAASRVWLPESGALELLGVRLESYHLRGLLRQLGIAPEVVRVGGFKGAGELLTRESMSPEQREQLEALAEEHYGILVEAIAEGRGLAPERVRALIDAGPYRARAAVEAGLVDGCLYPDELEDALRALVPGTPEGRRRAGSEEPPAFPWVDTPAYAALRASERGFRPLLGDWPRLACVVAGGPVRRGRGPRGIAAEPYAGLLEELARAPEVAGILLRVDSPGGDGVASDLLWRAVRQAGRRKPVVVSMGDVAASGAYYLAAAADAVFAEPGTLTGSIGVVGGKISLQGLYERLGVGKQAVERGARAGLLAEERAFTAEERAVVRRDMTAVYELFLERVAEGRGLEPAAVQRAAQGRVWSGRRARELGLVDALGGPLEALAELRRRAGIAPEAPVLLDLHPRRPRFPGLRRVLRGVVLGG